MSLHVFHQKHVFSCCTTVQDRKPLVEDVPEVPKELEETIAKAMLDEDLEQAQEADAEIRKVGPNKHFDFATSLM